MPKLRRLCGHVHDLSPIPDDGFVVIPDRDHEQYVKDVCEREHMDLRGEM